MKRHPVTGCVDVIGLVLEDWAETVVLLEASPDGPIAVLEETPGDAPTVGPCSYG